MASKVVASGRTLSGRIEIDDWNTLSASSFLSTTAGIYALDYFWFV